MTLRIEDPIREGGARRIMMTTEVPVAEIAFEGGRYVMHFHPLAGQLTPDADKLLRAAGTAEVKRLNAIHAITVRLMK